MRITIFLEVESQTSLLLRSKKLLKLGFSKDKQAEIVRIPPPIPAYPSKEILEKLRFFDKKGKKPISTNQAS